MGIFCPINSLLIGSRLDTDIYTKSCRLAFTGTLQNSLRDCQPEALQHIRIYQEKTKQGTVDRIMNDDVILVTKLFKRESNISPFLSLVVLFPDSGRKGTLDSSFGKSGKVKIRLHGSGPTPKVKDKAVLRFKKYLFNKSVKLVQ